MTNDDINTKTRIKLVSTHLELSHVTKLNNSIRIAMARPPLTLYAARSDHLLFGYAVHRTCVFDAGRLAGCVPGGGASCNTLLTLTKTNTNIPILLLIDLILLNCFVVGVTHT